ncbi:hypothetical protein [Paraconexibacter sp. AEG42_29]|uniref:hypothetical protein n=1 Tax=Paraconexibacter sp. AEG42_29 TaxID=2997339 RepID=UPI00339D49FB
MQRDRVALRRLQWRAAYNRHLATAGLVLMLVLAGWRTLDPPARVVIRERQGAGLDLPLSAHAARFAEAFVSFSSEDPEARERALAAFDGGRGAAGEGYLPPQTGSRRVLASQVVQASVVPQGTRFTIGLDTVPQGRIYLAVTATRDASGALRIVGFPAVVGGPLTAGVLPDPGGRDVDARDVRDVVTRALRNYLAGRVQDLPADLTGEAVISVPTRPLRLERISELRWEQGVSDSVLATVVAAEPDGPQMSLTYELALTRTSERWFVAAIHTHPTGR